MNGSAGCPASDMFTFNQHAVATAAAELRDHVVHATGDLAISRGTDVDRWYAQLDAQLDAADPVERHERLHRALDKESEPMRSAVMRRMGPDYDALRQVFDVMKRDVGELRTQLVAAVDNDPVGAADTMVHIEMNINNLVDMLDATMLEDRQKREQQQEQQRQEEQMQQLLQQAQLPHCPICYEVCEACRNPVHVECMREYVRVRGQNISCPVCRAPRRSEGA